MGLEETMSKTDTAHFATTDLLPRLVAEFELSPETAEKAASRLALADPRVKQAFWLWWTTGAIDTSLNIEGYTVERLLAEKKAATPVAAFATLAFLVNDPREAIRSLTWRERKPRFRSVPGS